MQIPLFIFKALPCAPTSSTTTINLKGLQTKKGDGVSPRGNIPISRSTILLIHKERISEIQPLSFPPHFSFQLQNEKKQQFLEEFLLRAGTCLIQSSVFLHINQSSLIRITETTLSLTRNCSVNTGVS